MGHPAKRHDRAQPWHGLDGCRQEGPASLDFHRQRLVLRRYATYRVADPAVDQRQPIIGSRLVDAPGKAVFDEGCVEQVAGEIAGKGSAGAVSPLQARRKAYDQQPPLAIAKRGYRRIEPFGFTDARRLAKGCEPRAEGAIAVGFGAEQGGVGGWRRAARRIVLNRQNRRHRPLAPWWSRAAGIAARDAAARGAPDARMGRGRAWIVVPPDGGKSGAGVSGRRGS